MGRNSIGIMQGRLSPSLDGRIQFFPWKTWEQEFSLAAKLGLSEIEFIFEEENYRLNPIYTDEGIKKIKELVSKTGVKVNFICADYFMQRPFFRTTSEVYEENIELLKHLISQAGKINIKGIEIPLVDNSSIKTEEEKKIFIRALEECLDFSERVNVEIGLETDLAPREFRQLLDTFSHPLLKANYDIGNSASLGYNIEEEFNEYGSYINNIHIKDRKRNGGTVPLGTGDADFKKFFEMVQKIGYTGSFILQAARERSEIETAKKNIAFVKNMLKGRTQ